LELKKYIDYIAKDKGDGDIFYTHSTSKTIRMGCLDGKVFLEEVSSKETSGYGVRIFSIKRDDYCQIKCIFCYDLPVVIKR